MSIDPLHIAMIGRSLGSGGGAGRLVEQLVAGLRQQGHVIDHFIAAGQATPPPESPVKVLTHPPLIRPIHQILRRAGRKLGYQARWGLDPMLVGTGQPLAHYPLYHIHDCCDAFSPSLVLRMARQAPVVWTMHDCSAFTGGCIQPMDCQRFSLGCGQCPQLGVWPIGRRDRTQRIAAANLRLLAHPNIHLIAPSQYMARMITSRLPNKSITVIHNAVNEQVFHTDLDRRSARQSLGIPPDKRWILLPAIRLDDYLKGFDQVVDALPQLEPDIGMLIMGNVDQKLLKRFQSRPTHPLGFIHSTDTLSLAYRAATAAVIPSRAENCSMTILEAQACGCPVIATNAGGNPEIIDSSSRLFEIGNIEQLAQIINNCSDDEPSLSAGRPRLAHMIFQHWKLYQKVLS